MPAKKKTTKVKTKTTKKGAPKIAKKKAPLPKK
jgi:hypothetical protein